MRNMSLFSLFRAVSILSSSFMKSKPSVLGGLYIIIIDTFLFELSSVLSISIIILLKIELNLISCLRVKVRLSAMKSEPSVLGLYIIIIDTFIFELSSVLSISIIILLKIKLNLISCPRVKVRLSAMKRKTPPPVLFWSHIVFVRIFLYKKNNLHYIGFSQVSVSLIIGKLSSRFNNDSTLSRNYHV